VAEEGTARSGAAADLRKVYEELRQPGRFDVLHIACHGLADSGDIDSTRLKMQGRFDDDEYIEDWLLATTIENEADLVGPDDERPLVVVNACQTGRLGRSLSGIGGFAPAFIRKGAGAFVGAHWSIGDDLAFTFVQALYGELRKGRPLAEATTLARRTARDALDPTWLAYTVYGEPGAKIVVQDGAVP
jgi:CHAT domain-containing protein